jgi:hypothetical protein
MVVKRLAQIGKYTRVGHFCITGHAPGCRQGSDVTMCSIAGEICCSTRAQYSVSWLGLFFLAPSPDNIHGVKQMSSFIVWVGYNLTQ